MAPYRDGATPCLRCGVPMETARTGAGQELETCPACGGAWMDAAAFLAELRTAQPALAGDGLLEFNDGSPRRPCPRCGDRMQIVWIELLQLDRCDAHGVWFDPGELDRAVAGETQPPEIARVVARARRLSQGNRRRRR
jgi:Zn-finger nucleic acid-binding protein